MARGTFISVILLVGVVGLALHTGQRTLKQLDQRINEFNISTDTLRSRIVLARGTSPSLEADVLAPVPIQMRIPML